MHRVDTSHYQRGQEMARGSFVGLLLFDGQNCVFRVSCLQALYRIVLYRIISFGMVSCIRFRKLLAFLCAYRLDVPAAS